MSPPQCIQWKEKPYFEISPGVRLREISSADAHRKVYFIEFDPYSRWPSLDVHDKGAEEIFVVQGIFGDGDQNYPAGSFIVYLKGSSHHPQSQSGCQILVTTFVE